MRTNPPSVAFHVPALPQAISTEGSIPDGGLGALTSRMAHHEEEAFVDFLAAFQGRLFRYLIVITRGDEQATREALQQTMLRVVKHVRRFDDESVFWSWLTKLARSSVIDDARKQNRYFALLKRFLEDRQTKPLHHVTEQNGDELLECLNAALPHLPTQESEIIRRKYFLGQTSREIAISLNTTEKAIESRLVRIRRQLRESILKEINHE